MNKSTSVIEEIARVDGSYDIDGDVVCDPSLNEFSEGFTDLDMAGVRLAFAEYLRRDPYRDVTMDTSEIRMMLGD